MKYLNLSVLAFLSMSALMGCGSPAQEEEITPVVSVKVARARDMEIPVRVDAPAVVYPREQASVASRLTARIVGLEARKGDSVTAGQVMARLESRDLEAQRDEAVAAVADAESSLEKVSSGTLPVEIQRARGQVAATRAALDQAQANYDRRRGLYDQGAIPERELLASRTELATAQANSDVAASELRLLEGQTGTRDVEIARSRLDQARSRLQLTEAQLEFATIRAPFSGIITEQFVFPGDMARPDTPLFSVADLTVAVAHAQIPEGEATEIRRGQACALAPLDGTGTSYAGRISVVSAEVDSQKRTVEVWCEIPNGARPLRSGAFGTVTITTESRPPVVAVPMEAVQFEEGANRGTVMVVGQAKMTEARSVETGAVSEGWVEIGKGLSEGEIVIVDGGYGLPDGTHVEWTGDPE